MEKQNPCETCSTYRESPLYIGNCLVYNPITVCESCPILYEQIKAQFMEGDKTNADEQ